MTRPRRSLWLSAAMLILAMGCSVRDAACGRQSASAPVVSEADQARAAGADAPKVKIAVLGDSITAGLGLLQNEAFPSLLQDKFDADGYDRIDVVNAGISGETSAGGLSRIDWVLESDVRILVLALGANDALRGVPPSQTLTNLAQIIQKASSKGVLVLLAGMEAPPNLGEDFRNAFRATFTQLVRQSKVTYLPFLLEGVAGNPALTQEDGIHPTAPGQRIIADLLYPLLQPMADDVLSR